MGRIAHVISTVRRNNNGVRTTDVKGDPGGGANVNAVHFADPGDDSLPLPGDSYSCVEAPGAGRMNVAGYADPASETKAAPGDKRIYSRSAPGEVSAEVWLKANGDILIKSLAPGRTVEIEATATVRVKAPKVLLGPSPGRPVACVGDFVAGSIHALSTAPGNPIAPAAGPPSPSGGVTWVGQIISGAAAVEAG